jgi:NAD(P)-dependent dehydrogenase (short-subunit alcohol dehydrogenase family)
VTEPLPSVSGRVAGKRAIVTGAGSGIGRASAERLAREGAHVALLDIDLDAAEEASKRLREEGLTTRAIRTDVTSEASVERSVDEAVAAFGGLDIVVANAAVQLFGEDDRADRLDLDVWRRTLDVNLTGCFLTCKHGVRALLASGGGSVVITASPTGLFGRARGFDAYSASKAGTYGLTRVMANDFARDGIRVNCVIPGFTDTSLVATVMQDDSAREALLETVPLGRPGSADEVASAILFLASDEAAYCTGSALTCDGGMTAI